MVEWRDGLGSIARWLMTAIDADYDGGASSAVKGHWDRGGTLQ